MHFSTTQAQTPRQNAASLTPIQGGLLQRKCACDGSANLTGECEQCRSKRLIGKSLQAKLRVGAAGDEYEREADRVAEHVMSMTEPSRAFDWSRRGAAALVQRRVAVGAVQRQEAGSAEPAAAENAAQSEGGESRVDESPCPSWFNDPQSISKRAAEHYVRNDMTPPSQATVKSIDCEPPIWNGNYGCSVRFSDGLVIRVIVRKHDIVVGTAPINTWTPPPATPLCFYNYACPGGQLVLTKRECRSAQPPGPTNIVQRSSRQEGSALLDATPAVSDVLSSPGEPLDAATRRFFAARFGHDFGNVRVHADARAAESARAVNALAYTVGNHVVFGTGQYAPESQAGQRLLAHELTHVIQQSGQAHCATGSVEVGPANHSSERQADHFAERVLASPDGQAGLSAGVAGEPVTAPASSSSALLQREAANDEHELQSIARAGERARQDPRNMTNLTIRGAEIVYRLIAKYFPEVSDRLSGVGADARLNDAIIANVDRNGSVSILIGPAFVLRTEREDLDLQRMRIRRALEVGGVLPKLSFQDALAEGATILRRAGFGTVCGAETGRDPEDGYDASEWREVGFERLEAAVTPWIAMDHLVKNLRKPVPKAGGGTTQWKFDCFGFVGVSHVYAMWRILPPDEFNKQFSPLQLGTQANVNKRWEQPILSRRPGEQPYREGEMKTTVRGGQMVFEPEKKPVGKSWAQLLKEAPIGTQVTWGNLDAQKRCREITSEGSAAGRGAAVCAWAYENTIKVGDDQFSAHPLGKLTPLGTVPAKRVMEEMAKAVNGGVVPPGYIQKNIYIDGMRFPKK